MSTVANSDSDSGALRLSALHVRRMPGIPEGFTLPELSEGVTVVFGPNASGKSSTARAIETVLWPGREAQHGVAVVAEYRMDGSCFRVDVDAGHVAVQRDGSEARAPELPAPELRHRYRLSLHELIACDNADFAKEIARQSAGGYDLSAAADALQFRAQPSAARNESAAVGQALETERTAQRAQRDLEERARDLDELRLRRDAARAARERQQLLALAVKHCAAAADVERARNAVAAFPPELGGMAGTEHDQLTALRKHIRERGEAMIEARAEERAAREAAARLLDGEVPDHAMLASLRAGLEELRELQRNEGECERTLEACTARQESARRVLCGAGDASDEQLARIDVGSFGELANFARESERAHAALAAADATLGTLADAKVPEGLNALRMGVELLSSWLAEGDGTGAGKSATAYLWGIALLAAIGWGLHALRWHWGFAVIAIIVLVAALLGSRRTAGRERRAVLRREYDRLGLPQPGAWTREAVRELHDSLQAKLAEGRLSEQRSVLRERVERERAAHEEKVRSIDARGAELAARLGVAPDTDQRTLSWLAERIGQWQGAALDVAAARAAVDAARSRSLSAIASMSAALGVYGCDGLDSTARLAGAVDDLESRVSDHAREVARAEDACRRIAELERSSSALEQECAELLERVGVQDDIVVESLCASFEEYRSACERERFATQACAALKAELRAAPGYEEELENGALVVLEREREDAAVAAMQFDELTGQVARLEQEVENAKRASDVEAAVAAVKSARGVLVEQRDRDLRAIIGGVIARHVQRLTRDQHRPEVFRRARELFTLITRGRYRLDFEDGDTPSFRAFDVNAGVGRSLEELSSATRVQLMLAVRVAFVESQERRVALPLLLDETLGTSDDDRARAIIDAVIVLAREGRQIFYFTAQHDEAGKWVAALEESGVPHTTVDLAAARGQRSSLALAPLAISSVSALDVPEPDGCPHDDYGARLSVSAFRPGLDAPDSVPLWYVVDDVDELCRLMQSGIATWGELRNLVENGGDRIVESCPALWRRARAYAGALEALCQEAAIGMGRPVDRSVLMDSGAVSEIQIERVQSLCERCGGDARALMEGLEAGGVSGFQKRKMAALREYLEDEGYLDERARRSEAQMRAAMLAAIGPAVSAGDILPADIDVILHRLELRRTSVVAAASPGARQTDSLAARISEG
ncbi:MAG TPA: hypothetical protein VFK04_07750 [Gemmatimonadaceae bacterium]|nr:hypothetical protein [Gemmatimonadaceae bacterium]